MARHSEQIIPAYGTWLRVDNAGRIFACTARSHLITVFRLSATLKKPVHIGLLQTALKATITRFPYFAMQLRRTVFWPCFEPNSQAPKVTADARYPCQAFVCRGKGRFPFRVRAFHRRIAVEFSHAITDATGALEFLRSLLADYLQRQGVALHDPGDLMLPDQTPDAQEFEDAFQRYCKKGLPHPDKQRRAFRLPFATDPRPVYHVTTGRVSLTDALACAKKHGVSLTELLISVYLDSLQSLMHDLPRRRLRPIRLDVPVNLRPFFPSNTLRNFFLPVYPAIDPRLGQYGFEEILQKVHHKMRHDLDEKELLRQIARNVGAERHPFIRTLPYWIKAKVMPEIYRRMALRRTTSSLSNTGKVNMPDELCEHIERFEFTPTYPNARKISCGCISFLDRLYITFGRTLTEPLLEQRFFRTLVALGCPVKIETN